jgi:YesN/AraC family two-component response regulator
MWKHRGTSKEIIQAVVMEWMVALYDYARQFGEQGECFFRQQATPHYSSILESRTLNQLSKLIQQTCEEWTAFLSTRKWTQPSNPVAAVRQIVDEHYAEPLSLKSLAERLYINAAYLGQLFKATEGITFNDYLLQLRMNKARDMLAYTDMKVYEIAMSVGYKELDWFYKKFKETYSLSASEYRLQFK